MARYRAIRNTTGSKTRMGRLAVEVRMRSSVHEVSVEVKLEDRDLAMQGKAAQANNHRSMNCHSAALLAALARKQSTILVLEAARVKEDQPEKVV
jgi:hypothetical protein